MNQTTAISEEEAGSRGEATIPDFVEDAAPCGTFRNGRGIGGVHFCPEMFHRWTIIGA